MRVSEMFRIKLYIKPTEGLFGENGGELNKNVVSVIHTNSFLMCPKEIKMNLPV